MNFHFVQRTFEIRLICPKLLDLHVIIVFGLELGLLVYGQLSGAFLWGFSGVYPIDPQHSPRYPSFKWSWASLAKDPSCRDHLGTPQ